MFRRARKLPNSGEVDIDRGVPGAGRYLDDTLASDAPAVVLQQCARAPRTKMVTRASHYCRQRRGPSCAMC